MKLILPNSVSRRLWTLPLAFFIVIFSSTTIAGNGQSNCQEYGEPRDSSNVVLKVDPGVRIRTLEPEFFGFNIEWIEFQLSLWDPATRVARPEVVDAMRAFPGATYRYPGGTSAEYFHAPTALGPLGQRPPQPLKPVTWHGPLVADFGPVEFLSFVQQTGGKAWYVLNLHGTVFQERSASAVAGDATALAAALKTGASNGLPEIYRWELGNELDRPPFSWPPEKYRERATAVASAISGVIPSAQFVLGLQDWDASRKELGIGKEEYNARLARGMGAGISEFATHRYYDGRPGRSVPFELKQLCLTDRALRANASAAPSYWITEHGRTPSGDPQAPDWKKQWPTSANLGAAISVADMAISLAKIPRVRGSMVHALHGTDGPWPLFHRGRDQKYHPSAVYWALRILRESMLEDVLGGLRIADASAYEGGYALNGIVMANQTRNRLSFWIINRADQAREFQVQLPEATSKTYEMKLTVLSASDSSAHNYGNPHAVVPRSTNVRFTTDSSGVGRIAIPPMAVIAAKLDL